MIQTRKPFDSYFSVGCYLDFKKRYAEMCHELGETMSDRLRLFMEADLARYEAKKSRRKS